MTTFKQSPNALPKVQVNAFRFAVSVPFLFIDKQCWLGKQGSHPGSKRPKTNVERIATLCVDRSGALCLGTN